MSRRLLLVSGALCFLASLHCAGRALADGPVPMDDTYSEVYYGTAAGAGVPILIWSDNFEASPDPWRSYDLSVGGVGDFYKRWSSLSDVDPCSNNFTTVAAFIDDGVVVPGTGGSHCMTWCYNPEGYIVNLIGGLAGPTAHIHNEIWSPEILWPLGYDGGRLSFDVYRHLPLSNGLFYVWHVRSSTDGGIIWSPWRDDQFVYYSESPDWLRVTKNITTLLQPGLNRIQVALGIIELGWQWGYEGTDGTPSPYFDNVQVEAFSCGNGPSICARAVDMFQDNFPAIGDIDYVDLGNNSVHVDPASPGTYMYVDAVPRAGCALSPPQMHVWMKTNPLFHDDRTWPAGFTFYPEYEILDGWVTGTLVPGTDTRYFFDLPDAGFFFPGDVFQYYVCANDGDAWTFLPDDLSLFGVFPSPFGALGYPTAFTVRALPTMISATQGDQPWVLFWNDNGDRGGEEEWLGALGRKHIGWMPGRHYDVFTTRSPSSGLGNGLGGRATLSHLSCYNSLLYTCGDLSSYTLSNGDGSPDSGNDLALLDGWFHLGGKHWFCSGNSVAYDLGRAGASGMAFRDAWLPMTFYKNDMRYIGGGNLLVDPVPGNPVGLTESYSANGGCAVYGVATQFDAVGAREGSSTRFASYRGLGAEFAAGLYIRNQNLECDEEIVYLPYDLMYIDHVPNVYPKSEVGLEKRAEVLREILVLFGLTPLNEGTGMEIAPGAVLSARADPNPFNPRTTIHCSLSQTGHARLAIYDLLGREVRVLVDEARSAGDMDVQWDGRDDGGRAAASGTYVVRLVTDQGVRTSKVTLAK